MFLFSIVCPADGKQTKYVQKETEGDSFVVEMKKKNVC